MRWNLWSDILNFVNSYIFFCYLPGCQLPAAITQFISLTVIVRNEISTIVYYLLSVLAEHSECNCN